MISFFFDRANARRGHPLLTFLAICRWSIIQIKGGGLPSCSFFQHDVILIQYDDGLSRPELICLLFQVPTWWEFDLSLFNVHSRVNYCLIIFSNPASKGCGCHRVNSEIESSRVQRSYSGAKPASSQTRPSYVWFPTRLEHCRRVSNAQLFLDRGTTAYCAGVTNSQILQRSGIRFSAYPPITLCQQFRSQSGERAFLLT